MIIFPAIDLRHGKCVRLERGNPDAETVYGEDPVAMAERWVDAGAKWLHIVNLDGAFGEDSPNPAAIRTILDTVAVPIQFGGGLRSLEDIEEALNWGVERVILGTLAVKRPDVVAAAVDEFGSERIVVGIDARDRKVAIHGWQEESEHDALVIAMKMKERGVKRIVYTDISRDGMLNGPNIEQTGELAQLSGMKFIASGGVGSIDHILQVRWIEPYGVEGVIVGQALYKGLVDLSAAIAAVEQELPA